MLWVLVALGVVASVHPATTAVVRWADDRRVRAPWRPRCVADTHDLAPADVVPVWSWLARRGTCRTCGEHIPGSLPLVEVGVVVLLAAVAWRHPGPVLVLLLPVAWSVVVATPIDLARMIIPDRLTFPLAGWSVVAATGLALAGVVGVGGVGGVGGLEGGDWADWRRAMLVGIALPGGMLALSLAFQLARGQVGMGMGDVKWGISLGVAMGWLGPWSVVAFLVATVLASGVVAIVLLALGHGATARFPFGPYLAVGTVVGLLVPADVVRRLLL